MNLLIVNNQQTRHLESVLKKEGYQVKTACHGREALSLLQKEHFDGIVSDVFMPVMDGFQLCRRVKSHDRLKKIPFIFLASTSFDDGDEWFAKTVGCNLFLTTSEPDTVLPQIKKVLQHPKEFTEVCEEKEFLQEYSARLKKKFDSILEQMEETQKKLSQSEKKYQNLFEGAHDATFIMNTEGRQIEANKRASELLGYTLEEFRELSFREIVVPSYISDSEEKLKLLHQGEDVPIYEKEFRTKDGKAIPVEISVSGIKDESGRIAYIQSIVRDIEERKKAERALQESEEKYRSLVENVNVGVYRVTPGKEGKFVDVNQAFAKMLGYTKEEILKLKVSDTYMNPKDRKKFSGKVSTQEVVKNEELHLKRKDKTPIICSDTAAAVYDSEGTLLYFDGIVEDITERKKMEEALKESEGKYRTLIENSKDSIVIIDLKGNVQFANKATEELTGYTMGEGVHMNVRQITPLKYWPKSLFMLKKAMSGEPVPYFESVIKRKDSRYVPVESGGQAIFRDGKVVGIQIITRDITERKQAEEQIKASLREKEVLLKEIHHRVKNNMQIISSLLNLQSKYIKDSQLLEVFKDIQNRIHSMALVHENLYQSKDLASINIKEYIKSLTRSLVQSWRIGSSRITLKLDVENVSLGSDHAIPCGLIINELVSNSLKHAFPGKKRGEITVSLHPCDGNEIELVVKDDGVGIPEGIDFRNTQSLGLCLVTILAEDQLDGKIRVERTEGTEVSITFRVA